MPLFTPSLDRWMSEAACAGSAPLFDPDASERSRADARAICLDCCPVLEQCRTWAESASYTGVAAGEYYRRGVTPDEA